jgi:thiamine biosynthesis lipoprotein
MASPCEVHVADASARRAQNLADAVAAEARRVEKKFSRYATNNVVYRINHACGQPVSVDDETARLLTYAAELYELSEGRFDITTGAMRRAWRFDGGSDVPDDEVIGEMLQSVGWPRVQWESPVLQMPAGMEIDFGGIGKEYAVDRAARIAARLGDNFMINFGGDLAAQGGGMDGSGWIVGVEGVAAEGLPAIRIRVRQGGVATSGDARRFVTHNGEIYGHILDARTGWPAKRAPRSVTVVAPTCTIAGMLATFAILQGETAEAFLDAQGVRYWCMR